MSMALESLCQNFFSLTKSTLNRHLSRFLLNQWFPQGFRIHFSNSWKNMGWTTFWISSTDFDIFLVKPQTILHSFQYWPWREVRSEPGEPDRQWIVNNYYKVAFGWFYCGKRTHIVINNCSWSKGRWIRSGGSVSSIALQLVLSKKADFLGEIHDI